MDATNVVLMFTVLHGRQMTGLDCFGVWFIEEHVALLPTISTGVLGTWGHGTF